MKFSMTQAWDNALAILRANAGLMAIVAGLFVFLPSLALGLFNPALISGPVMPDGADMEQMQQIFTDYYLDNGVWMAVTTIIGLVGSLALYALVGSDRPTVAEALKRGAVTLLPNIAAQLIYVIVLAVIGGLLIGIPAALGVPALAVLLGLIFAVFFIYAIVKLSMVTPVMVIERTLNPIAAIIRSWKLTKGNSLRLFGYYLILAVCFLVIAAVLSMVSMTLMALLGSGTAGVFAAGFVSGLMGAIYAAVIVAILAAVHRQLVGQSPQEVSEAFE